MKWILFFTTCLVSQLLLGQQWQLDTVGQLPDSVSNNAVAYGMYQNEPYAFSFSGIGSGKTYQDIHLKSYRCNLVTGNCDTLMPLPDTLGKVAAGASRIGDVIYIIGGYHVYANGDEKSSSLVHRFHIPTQTYLTDGAEIPVPIDDHVQVVYRDSLIYCITGWHDTRNVEDVQVYDVVNNVWLQGTSVPNNSIYESFGASGTIVGDTIYYFGGARFGFNFPAQNYVRKGVINPANPLDISWDFFTPDNNQFGYRMAAATIGNDEYWLGGSGVTYNYNGVAYNGSGGVEPQQYVLNLRADSTWNKDSIAGLPMDLRGLVQADANELYFMGGMLANQEVSDQLLKLTLVPPVGLGDVTEVSGLTVYPNPSRGEVTLEGISVGSKVAVYAMQGTLIKEFTVLNQQVRLNVQDLPKGMYVLRVEGDDTILQTILSKQ